MSPRVRSRRKRKATCFTSLSDPNSKVLPRRLRAAKAKSYPSANSRHSNIACSARCERSCETFTPRMSPIRLRRRKSKRFGVSSTRPRHSQRSTSCPGRSITTSSCSRLRLSSSTCRRITLSCSTTSMSPSLRSYSSSSPRSIRIKRLLKTRTSSSRPSWIFRMTSSMVLGAFRTISSRAQFPRSRKDQLSRTMELIQKKSQSSPLQGVIEHRSAQ